VILLTLTIDDISLTQSSTYLFIFTAENLGNGWQLTVPITTSSPSLVSQMLHFCDKIWTGVSNLERIMEGLEPETVGNKSGCTIL
jgi:hypothetical protein